MFAAKDAKKYLTDELINSMCVYLLKFKGFDDQGRQYDADGNLADFWHSHTKMEFLKRTKCFVHQYSNYFDAHTNLTVRFKSKMIHNNCYCAFQNAFHLIRIDVFS